MSYDYVAYGAVPIKPVYFYDFDGLGDYSMILDFAKRHFANFDIYRTKKGFHLVAAVKSWDDLQGQLTITKKEFPETSYILNCRKLRLRISPKWGPKGDEVSPAPELALCFCPGQHHDKRKEGCKEVGYYTRST